MGPPFLFGRFGIPRRSRHAEPLCREPVVWALDARLRCRSLSSFSFGRATRLADTLRHSHVRIGPLQKGSPCVVGRALPVAGERSRSPSEAPDLLVLPGRLARLWCMAARPRTWRSRIHRALGHREGNSKHPSRGPSPRSLGLHSQRGVVEKNSSGARWGAHAGGIGRSFRTGLFSVALSRQARDSHRDPPT